MNYFNQPNQTILPWHAGAWQLLWRAHQQASLPHAVLLTGAQGLGKHYFAEQFAQAVLCSAPAPSGAACENCHNCHLVRAKSHPDFKLIAPIENQTIKIDQTREVNHFVQQTSMQGRFRVIIISPAHAMTVAAANALLKTLEEPAAHTLLLLISDQRLKLPATIAGRCQKLFFAKPQQNMALAWLREQVAPSLDDATLTLLFNLAEGAPLKVQMLLENDILALRQTIYQGLIDLSIAKASPVQLAADWQERPLLLMIELIGLWLRDLLWFKLSQGSACLINQDHADFFANFSPAPAILVDYFAMVRQRFAAIHHSQSINRQLVLEELLIQWTFITLNKSRMMGQGTLCF